MNVVVFILLIAAAGLLFIGFPVGVTVACADAVGQLVGRGDPDRRWNARVAAWASAVMIGGAFWAAPLATGCLSIPVLVFLRGMRSAIKAPRLPALPPREGDVMLTTAAGLPRAIVSPCRA